MEEIKNTDCNLITGLTSEEVETRVKSGLVNGLQTIKTKSVLRILIDNTFTFFNFVFFVMAIIVAAFSGFDEDGMGNYGFVILCVCNTLIGIVQELRAKHTMDKLSLISAPKVRVIRDGEEKEIAVKDVVMDDVTILQAGHQICADSVVVEGSIEVNESLITGEPDAIVKHAGDSLMSGSYVVSGRAKAKVVHVGMDNFAMKISAGAKYFKKPVSVIKNSLNKIVKTNVGGHCAAGHRSFFSQILHSGQRYEQYGADDNRLVGRHDSERSCRAYVGRVLSERNKACKTPHPCTGYVLRRNACKG